MKLDKDGLRKLSELEGWRSTIYRDEAGKETIGYGHKLTAADQKTKRFAKGLSKPDGWELLREDVAKFEDGVTGLLTRELKAHEFAALVLFAYNVGLDAFRRSRLLTFVNVENGHGVPAEFMRWVFVTNGQGTKVRSPGLTARRRAEAAIWEGRDAGREDV